MEKRNRQIVFYVQHLLGSGHLMRTLAIAKAVADCGAEAIVVSGGRPVSHFDYGKVVFHQLPPLHSLGNGSGPLRDEMGSFASSNYMAHRLSCALNILSLHRPSVFVTELFPFGRHMLKDEFSTVIDFIKDRNPGCKIVSSIRDILEPKNAETMEWMARYAASHFDCILVHGDSRFMGVDAKFPHLKRLETRLRYTGYVLQGDLPKGPAIPSNEIVVSAGGAADTFDFFEGVAKALVLADASNTTWRFTVSPSLKQCQQDRLKSIIRRRDIFEHTHSGFLTLVRDARLVICQAGYNTLMETIKLGTPAVVLPRFGRHGVEQVARADALHKAGLVTAVSPNNQTPAGIAHAINVRMAKSEVPHIEIDLDGATSSAKLLLDMSSGSPAT